MELGLESAVLYEAEGRSACLFDRRSGPSSADGKRRRWPGRCPEWAKAAGLNACKLLKNSEVVKAIGEPVASKRGGSSATGAKYCNWYGADKRVAQKGITLIAAKDFAKLRFKKYKKQLNANKPVKGVGDVAATDGQVLIARIGDHRFVYVSPLNSHSGITLDALKPLARKALNRIP